jgi:hypothetical protein
MLLLQLLVAMMKEMLLALLLLVLMAKELLLVVAMFVGTTLKEYCLL